MIVVDSSVWVDYFNGVPSPQTDKLDSTLEAEPIVVGDIILTEVLQGFRFERHYTTAKELLTSMIVLDMIGTENAIAAADNFRTLRKKGVTIRKTIDTWIATFCIKNDLRLLYSDRDFDPFTKHLKLRSALE